MGSRRVGWVLQGGWLGGTYWDPEIGGGDSGSELA